MSVDAIGVNDENLKIRFEGVEYEYYNTNDIVEFEIIEIIPSDIH